MSRFARNAVFNVVGQGVALLLGLLSVKCVYTRLGGDTVGIIFFALMASTTLCNVLELGILSTTVREVSANCDSDRPYTEAYIRSFSSFYWIFFCVFGIAIYFAAPFIASKWLILRDIDQKAAESALRILLISSLLALPRSFYASVIRGLQRMEINNVIDPALTGLQQLGIILIAAEGGNLLHVACWIAVTNVIGVIAYVGMCARFFSFRRALIPGYSASVVTRNWSYTANMMVISLTALGYLQADKVILSKVLPVEWFGYYYFAYTLVSKGAAITMAVSNAAFPHLSNLYANYGATLMGDEYHKLQNTLCVLIAPIFAAISFASVPLFSHVFTTDIAKSLAVPTVFLCLGFYMTGTLTIPNVISFVVGKPNIVARQNIIALFVILPVAFFGIRVWGILGASLSMVVYGLFCYLYSIPTICTECIGITPSRWYSDIAKHYLLVAATYGVCYAVVASTVGSTVYALLVSYGIATVLLVAGAWYFFGDLVWMSIPGGLRSALPSWLAG